MQALPGGFHVNDWTQLPITTLHPIFYNFINHKPNVCKIDA